MYDKKGRDIQLLALISQLIQNVYLVSHDKEI